MKYVEQGWIPTGVGQGAVKIGRRNPPFVMIPLSNDLSQYFLGPKEGNNPNRALAVWQKQLATVLSSPCSDNHS